MKLTFFDDATKKQTILQGVVSNECIHSRFNTRKIRTREYVERLAGRIRQNGFELTRAPWAYRNGKGILEIFAGGTRLEAAKSVGVTIPIVLFEGYTDEEIARLTDQDNEDDEYHTPVGPVEVWAEYARLRDEEGWTQQHIAEAKGVSQKTVSVRLKLHGLPDNIKDFIPQGLLSEAHLVEITGLYLEVYFSPWLTTEQAWGELAEWAAQGHSVSKTQEEVKRWKNFVGEANCIYCTLKPITLYEFFEAADKEPEPFVFDMPTEFVAELSLRHEEAVRKVRSLNKVQEAIRAIRIHVAENLQRYEEWVATKSAKAAKEARYARREKELLDKYLHGDCLELADRLEDKSVRLMLIDPPYGKDFQSNRRIKSVKAPKILGDTPNEAIELFSAMLEVYKPKLQEEVHILSFCDWQSESDFRRALEQAGFVLRGSLIWVKENHSAGDLQGTFAPKHDRILHATLGRPSVEPRIDDVLIFSRDLNSKHPTAKPIPLLEQLILSCTVEGQLVIDPMAGCAPTLLAAWNQDREFWGCEIDGRWHDLGCGELLKQLKEDIENESTAEQL